MQDESLPVLDGAAAPITVHIRGNTRAWEQGHLALVDTTKAGRPCSQEKCDHLPAQEILDITPVLTVH
jgi:hypothetical protein